MNHNVNHKRQKYNVPKVDLAIMLNSPENLNSMEISKDAMEAYSTKTKEQGYLYGFIPGPSLNFDLKKISKIEEDLDARKMTKKFRAEKAIRGISDNITNELCINGFLSPFDLVDRIYLADPKTIVIFKDGTKSILTCSKGDTYNRTAGILLCIMKRFYPGTQTQFSKDISALEEKAEFPQMSNKEFKIAKKKFEKALKKTSVSF